MTLETPLHTEIANGVLTITLNRPKANAFNAEMSKALLKTLKKAEHDESIRVVVLTGAGKLFSAGQDLGEFGEGEPIPFRKHIQATYNPLVLQLRRLGKPIIAAINGAVAGAALGIALACDLRIAAEDTRFIVGFSGIGLAPDSAVSLILPQLIGLGRATEYTFTNQPITAEQALAWGLVNRVVPAKDLAAAASTWAEELARGPVHAMGLAKRAFNKAILPHLEEVLDYEAHIQDIAGKAHEHQEGIAAFREKRDPRFI